MVNGNVLDVTWYLTQVVITVDDDSLDQVDEYSTGPVTLMCDQRRWDPNTLIPKIPNQSPFGRTIEEDYLYERDDETEDTLKQNMWVGGQDDGTPENPEKLYVKQETREDMAAMSEEEEAQLGMEEGENILSAFAGSAKLFCIRVMAACECDGRNKTSKKKTIAVVWWRRHQGYHCGKVPSSDLLSSKSRLTDLNHNKRDTEYMATGNELTKAIPGYVSPLQLDIFVGYTSTKWWTG